MFLGHVAYHVSDIEKTLDFYCRGLGFKKHFEMLNAAGEVATVYVKVNEREFIEFFPAKEELKPNNGSFSHLCLHTDDIEKEMAELAARGVVPHRPIAKGKSGCLMAWVADPDGNQIEIMELTPDSMQLKN